MTAPIHERGLKLNKEFEGFHKQIEPDVVVPYLCPANVPTIAYGATYYRDGTRVTLNDGPMTRVEGEALLDYQLLDYLAAVDRGVNVPIHEFMRAALGTFTYNVGKGAFKASTLRRKLNRRDYVGALRQFPKWRIGGGRVLAGLVRRRKAEAGLFADGLAEMGVSGAPSQPDASIPLPDRGERASVPWYRKILTWIWG